MKQTQKRNAEKPYLKILFSFVLQNWKIFTLSILCCFAVAVLHLKSSTKIYRVTAKVLLKDDEKGSFASQLDMLSDFGYTNANTNVENEIEVMRSKSVVRMAILASQQYIKYHIDGFLSDQPIYKTNSPVIAKISQKNLESLKAALTLEFTLTKDSLYKVSYKYKNLNEGYDIESSEVMISSFPYNLKTIKGDIELSVNENVRYVDDLFVTIYPIEALVGAYSSALFISPISKTASVSNIAFNDAVPLNGVDFINALISCYNIQANEDKNIIMQKTKEFVDARITMIGEELKEREENLANFKRNNKIVDAQASVARSMSYETEYSKKLEEINMQLTQSQFILKYIADSGDEMKTIPTTLGLASEPTISALITKYNAEVIERHKFASIATDENPMLTIADESIKKSRKDIVDALNTLSSALEIRKNFLEDLVDKYSDQLAKTPSMELEVADLTRERDIKAQLYVMLLQKYEENALALAATADNLKCIDPASALSSPVAPNNRNVFLMAFALGVFIPAVYLYIRNISRTKIESVAEIEELTLIPIVGSIPLCKDITERQNSIVVQENNNNLMAEAFRIIRTNLQFVIKECDGNVIMFTSTTSGEGKTFISSNYAISLAFLGKKVLYMGLDIRRPRLAEVFNIDNNLEGITSFLASDGRNLDSLDKYIVHSSVSDNLYLLPAGVIPPNPAELLAKDNLDKAIEYLSKKFDYIVMDTAPVGLVTDSIILSRVADAVVYITRINYTEREAISYLNSLVDDEKLNKVSIVLNAEDMHKRSKSYGYHGYYGHYGYGYVAYGNEKITKKTRKK